VEHSRTSRMTASAETLRMARLSEDDLLTSVLDLCRALHLRTAHFRPARTAQGWRTPVSGDGKGWPDLVIVGPRRLIMRELKSDVGRPSPAQLAWGHALATAGVDAGVWRPRDWRSGAIGLALRELAGRG